MEPMSPFTSVAAPQTYSGPTIVGPTFRVGEFEFPLPESDPTTHRITAGSLLNLLLVAVAFSEDKQVRNMLKEAQIEIVDVNGKRFFPRTED